MILDPNTGLPMLDPNTGLPMENPPVAEATNEVNPEPQGSVLDAALTSAVSEEPDFGNWEPWKINHYILTTPGMRQDRIINGHPASVWRRAKLLRMTPEEVLAQTIVED